MIQSNPSKLTTIKPISISTSPTSTTSTSSSSTTSSSSSSSTNHHHHLNQSDYHHQHQHQPTTTNNNNSNNDNSSSSLPHDIFSITDEELAAQYTFETEIGYGNWGSIWRISTNPSLNDKNQLRLKKTLAIKLVHRDKTSNTTNARVKSLWGEFKTLRRFKSNPSPNVLRISSFIITPSYALLTMAFHPNLLPVRLSESNPKTLPYLRGLLAGIEFLHRHHITHNDIKPANVVISEQDQPVFIDFGFAVSYGSDWEGGEKGEKKYWSQLSWGTPEYLSPQRARGEPHDERLSDIWSLGITMYEVVVGRTPFESDDHEEFLTKEALQVYYERTLTGEFLGVYQLSRSLKDLLKSMVQPDPKRRLTSCANGMLHPFFEAHSSPPHSRRSVIGIGSSIQDRLKTFETKQGVPTPINKPIQQLVTNGKLKPETTSSIKVFRDQPELNTTKTPLKKNSLPPRVLTPQCQNTPPVSTMTKRVPVPYSKLQGHHQQQQENLNTERTPTLANGRHYVTKTPAVVKKLINTELQTPATDIHVNKQDHLEGEPPVKKLNVAVERTTRVKMIKDDVKGEQEEEVYQALKLTTGSKNESMKKNRHSNQSCERESTLTPKDRQVYQTIGSMTTTTSITRMKSPRKPAVQSRLMNVRPKTAGPNIKVQSEGVSRYRPRSANGPSGFENHEVKVEPRKLFKESRMENKSEKKALVGVGLSPRVIEEKKVEKVGLGDGNSVDQSPSPSPSPLPSHLNSKLNSSSNSKLNSTSTSTSKNGTPNKNTSINQYGKTRNSLSSSPNQLERTKSLIKRKEEVQSKIPQSIKSRIRTSSVKVNSIHQTRRQSNGESNQQKSLISPCSSKISGAEIRRRTNSSGLVRNTKVSCNLSASPLRKERSKMMITTPVTNRIRTTSVRVGTGKGLGSLERGKKSSLKGLKIKSSRGSKTSGYLGMKDALSPQNRKLGLSHSHSHSSNRQSNANSNSNSNSNSMMLSSRSRSCFIGPSLIK